MVEAIDGVILVGVPKGAAVRIERHRAVVAPSCACAAAAARLRAGALDENLLGLAEGVGGVAGQTARIHDRRFGCAAGSAVAKGEITVPVDCQAGHEAVNDVGAVGVPSGGLREVGRDRTTGDVDLIPAWGCETGGVGSPHRMRDPQRLDPADTRVLVLHHRPDRQHVQTVAAQRGRVRDTSVRPAGGSKRHIRAGKGRQRDLVPVDMKLVDSEGVQELPGRHEKIGPAEGRGAGLQPRVARHQGEIRSRRIEGNDLNRGAARVHLRLVEGPDPGALVR